MTNNSQPLDEGMIGCFSEGTGAATDCVLEGMFAAGPAPELIGLLLGGTLVTSLYVAGDGTVVVPAVVTILVGSVMVPLLPAQYVSMAWAFVFLGTALAVFSAYTRFTHQGGF